MRQGLKAWFSTGAQITAPYFLTLIAEASASAGRFDEARDAISQAVAHANRDVELWWQAEQYRVHAELLIRESASRGEAVHPEAEAWAQKALDVARRQRAKSIELRTVMTIARMRACEGRAEEGRQLLRNVHASFTEGFDTADLKAARTLLAEA